MEEITQYKVLARKYRPQQFKDLVGQDLITDIISSAIINERLAHAYVLTGVRGVGKTTTARLIAMSINCQNRQEKSSEPCRNCDSCKSTVVDSNLDVIEMDAASNTGVDDVREIIDNVKYKPVIGKYKIFIIDEVHMLSKSAFNALLKTLEEPPDHVKFIFATTEVKKIPITVLSRCQRFDLLRIDNKILGEHLLKIIHKEKIDIDNDAVSLIVRAADGSVRDALSLLDQAMTNQNVKIDALSITKMLGLAEREKIFELLEKILEGNSLDALGMYRKLYDLGADVIMIFDELINVVHFLTQIKIAPDLKNDIYIPEIERSRGSELSSKLTLNNLNIIWQILFKGYQELQTGFHLFQHGEMLILRIIYLFDGPSPDDLLKNISIKEKNLSNEKLNNQSKNNDEQINKVLNFEKSTQKDDTKRINNQIKLQNYRQFVELFFKNREGILHTKLYNEVRLVSFKEGEVFLNTDRISDKSFNRTIAKLISTWTGRIWQIHSSSSNLGKSLYEEDIIEQQIDIEKMKNNAQVIKILKEFPDSRIHSISDLTDVNTNEEIINLDIKKEK
ncbi:DNA polymerase III subunit gamma/tau [Pelagibacteraceae bacterium]|nr:DNA polymerase III subunit gamma/tau [Pelagibacteraceae bacterium]